MATRITECTHSSSQDGEALLQAARLGRVSDVRYLIKEKGCDPMSRDEHGETVLHLAAFRGQLQVVQCLIDEFGVDPKSCLNHKGQTPLHAAAHGGELSVLRYLIKEKGCDPMSRAEWGWTPLHAAAVSGDLQVIQCLIEECGVDPKSCIDYLLSTIILGQNERIQEYFKSKIPNFELVVHELVVQEVVVQEVVVQEEREKKLESGDLHQISSYLHDIPYEALLHLGVALGLNYIKLKHLDRGTFLLDMLSMWLREEDDVIKLSGPPTWRSLVTALRADTVAQKGIADTIEKQHL